MEDQIQSAISAYKSGDFKFISQCAKAYDVPYQRLKSRIHGRNPARGGHNKLLSDDQEQALTRYLDRCILLGRPSKKRYLRAAANSILQYSGGSQIVSRIWTSRFLSRHPKYYKRRTKPLSAELQAA